MVGNPEDRSSRVKAQIISMSLLHFPQIDIFSSSNFEFTYTSIVSMCRYNSFHYGYTNSACSNSAQKFYGSSNVHSLLRRITKKCSTIGPGFITMKSKISRYAYRQGNSSRKVAQPKSR